MEAFGFLALLLILLAAIAVGGILWSGKIFHSDLDNDPWE